MAGRDIPAGDQSDLPPQEEWKVLNKKRITTVLGALGVATAATMMVASPAMADAHGHSYYAGIDVYGSGLYVDHIHAYAYEGPPTFYGHFQVTANGVTIGNTVTGYWPAGTGHDFDWKGNMADQTQVCVTAWSYTDHWYSLGKACETIHS